MLLVAWLPPAIRALPISLPIVCVGLGVAVAMWTEVSDPLPELFQSATERITELLVVVTLMTSGLKLNRRLGWRRWITTWRLLGIAMPLSILGIALVAHWGAGLTLPIALLIGAALAPTDPVLAADVQVSPPSRNRPSGESDDEVRFALTSEAGLNDGLAFPFVSLALLAARMDGGMPDLHAVADLALGVLWRLFAGVAVGLLLGRVLGWLTFHLPHHTRLSETGDGLVAVGSALTVYAITESLHGYGFIAVFLAGLMIRDSSRNHEFHVAMHDFSEQLERLAMMPLLAIFGASLPALLPRLIPADWVLASACVLLIRPLAGLLALLGLAMPWRERAIIAIFGIRGMGSVYYLSYALNRHAAAEAGRVWAIVALTIVVSIVLHGATATAVMRRVRPEAGA